MPHDTEIFLDGFEFTEGLRWHQNKLWFCDLWAKKVYCFNNDGAKEKEIDIDDKPVGLGWLSDDSLLITSLMKRKLLRFCNNELTLYKSLDVAKPGYCHDFTILPENVVYISASGFYPAYGVNPVTSNILMLTPDKEIRVAATGLGYPNGIVATPDGKHLIVAETFAAQLSIFDIAPNYALTNKRVYAKFDDLGFQVKFDQNGIPEDKSRHYPDGICFDEELDAVWVASPGRNEVLCVRQGGEVIKTVHTISYPFDCVLGGHANNSLFIASSDMGDKSGKIERYFIRR